MAASSPTDSPTSYDVASDTDVEERRLKALRRYDALDGDVRDAYDHVAELAAHVLDAPIAFVTLIEEDCQHMKACVGRNVQTIGLDNTFCVHTIQSPGVLVVEDALEDERFADMPTVQGEDDTPGLRFYAGAPLTTPDGYRVGTLCVLDTEPRPRPSDEKIEHLKRLAQVVVDELELRRETAERREREQDLRQTSQRAEVARAVAQRARAEAEEARENAEQASRSKSHFLAGVAHDLRSPLSVINGFAELLMRELDGTEADHADKIYRAAQQLNAMATSLSDLAQLESGEAGFATDTADLLPLVQDATVALHARARQAGVDLTVDLPDEPVEARVDGPALRRVVDNLVSNAIKYCTKGDRVTVRVVPTAGRETAGGARDGDGSMSGENSDADERGDGAGDRSSRRTGAVARGPAVVVEDTGPGIDPEFLPNVFQPFARNAPDTEGTGLGLAVSRELVEAMDGAIEVDSTLGEGTTFRVRLQPPDAPALPSGPPSVESTSGEAGDRDADARETGDRAARSRTAGDRMEERSDGEQDDDADEPAAAEGPSPFDGIAPVEEGREDVPELHIGRSVESGERRLRNLVDRLPGAVYRCTYDTEWISIYMGEGFREITGIDPQALDPAGRSFKEVIVEEDRDKIRKQVREAVENRSYYSIEYRVRADDGSIRWVEDNGRPVFQEDGSVQWLDGILLDVTGRKDAEQKLRQMNETLEEKVEQRTLQLRRLSAELAMAEQRERDQIARVIHDDLQQFLYAVQVETKMLVDGIDAHPGVDTGDLPVDPGYIADLLQQAIETTRGLTVDLSPPVLERDGLVEALQWLRSHMADRRDFTIVLEGEGPETALPEELRMVLFQAVRELVRNASEHAGVDTARVEVETDDGDLLLRVIDDGVGFEPDDELEKDTPGFGLHNVRERLRFFGASFTIDSSAGRGARCTIRLPASEQSNVGSVDRAPEAMDSA